MSKLNDKKLTNILLIIIAFLVISYLYYPIVKRYTYDAAYIHYYSLINPSFKHVSILYTVISILIFLLSIFLLVLRRSPKRFIGVLLLLIASGIMLAIGPTSLLLYGVQAALITNPMTVLLGFIGIIGCLLIFLDNGYLEAREEKKILEEQRIAQEQAYAEGQARIQALKDEASQRIEDRLKEIRSKNVAMQATFKQETQTKIVNESKEDESINDYAKTHEDLDLLKRYKELLDEGILSQEEFDLKKKELLGL